MVVWSMYCHKIWGFEQEAMTHGKWRVGKLVLGVCAACILYVIWVIGQVMIEGEDGGNDPGRWAWIDVVSENKPLSPFRHSYEGLDQPADLFDSSQ